MSVQGLSALHRSVALSSGEKGGDRLSAQTVTSAAREDGAVSTDKGHPP